MNALHALALTAVITLPLCSSVDCSDSTAMRNYALKHAVSKNHHVINGDLYALKQLESKDGYAYLFYFNTSLSTEFAGTVLVAMDRECKIRFVEGYPRESDLKLIMSVN